MQSPVNSTFIALILKKDNPEMISNFRYISLCNVLYKIVSKVICNRLKNIMLMIIFRMQSAFIHRRLITDNIMMAYELLHSMKVNKKKKEGAMTIKLDMSIAYDRIEWPYLQAVLTKLGFSGQWKNLIMTCVTYVWYQVLVNGRSREVIIPSKGLRQGDPMSPYMFLLCAEGLNFLMG